MKRYIKRGLTLALLSAMLLTLAACGGGSAQVQYEVPSYQGQLQEGQTKSDYNKELFYRNDKQTRLADPFVLDNTEVDGYYYMYGTEGSLFCYRSQNLMDLKEADKNRRKMIQITAQWMTYWATLSCRAVKPRPNRSEQ